MKRWIVLVVGLCTLAGLAFWAYGAVAEETVTVVTPERREAIRAIFASGSVRAEQMARIRPDVGGEVLAVSVRQGEEIREGDPVLEIKVNEEQSGLLEQQARLREAQVTLSEASAALEHERQLLEQGASTQEAVDRAASARQRASAHVGTLRAALSARRSISGRGKIKAPITGVVTQVGVNAGDVVPPGVEAITILDPASFKVVADVDELDITRIRPGQEAIVAFDALPGARFRARVERIIPQADEVTRTLPVILALIDGVPNLSDGLTATINIVQERRPNALTVPLRAIITGDRGAASIFVVDRNGKVEKRSVRLGVRGADAGEDFVEVIEGLTEEERVVVDPDPQWQGGEEVVVRQTAAGDKSVRAEATH